MSKVKERDSFTIHMRETSYSKYLEEIKKAYQESKSWDNVITTVVYRDVEEAQEAFIDYVEETYKTKVKDAKHLQKITGITEDTPEGLEEIVINSRRSKYNKALEMAIVRGAKYKDLLQIKPQDYGLPETWSYTCCDGYLGTGQYSTILWALCSEYLIDEPAGLMLLPDLRSIAKDIEAPYSVVMDCHKLTKR